LPASIANENRLKVMVVVQDKLGATANVTASVLIDNNSEPQSLKICQ